VSYVDALAAALDRDAHCSDLQWKPGDAESCRLAVEIAVLERADLCAGFPQPGRTALLAPGGVLTLWPDELLARVGAGMSVAELEDRLAARGLALGLEVPDPEETTLGACFADARRGFAGPFGINLRDRTVGLSFVDGRARLLAAGARVVKNVAGYDFGRLHHGAAGSLGMLLDFTVRLIARPQCRVAAWWPCQREELSTRLPRIRERWGHDSVAEILVDPVAAVRFGLPGPGLVFRQFGEEEVLQSRIRRTEAVDVSDRWARLLPRSRTPAIRLPLSTLSVQDPGRDWVADLGWGLLRRASGESDSRRTPSAASIALKQVFDPHGIWPALPRGEPSP
jgi:hypothetical protein